MEPQKKRISSIDLLRGVAAFSVCIFHFTNGNPNFFQSDSWLKKIGSTGWVGVEIFFVISGFIIPYSMQKGRYTYKGWYKFLLKRVVRIDPPYIVSIAIIITLNYVSTLSPYYQGNVFTINYLNILLHMVYLNAFFNQPWINPVFWTLAIEFQFYLLMALLLPIIMKHKRLGYFIFVLLTIFSAHISSESYIFHYIVYFLIGIILFLVFIDHTSKLLGNISCFILIGYLSLTTGLAPVLATGFAYIIISWFPNLTSKPLLFLGTISYSLYLTHVPIGGRIINLSIGFIHHSALRVLVVIITLIICILFSFLFYQYIEKPFLKIAKKLF